MIKQSLPRQYAEALICPSCGASRLIPTKEKIIICQDCFTGYRMQNGIPDFRLEYAISFKNKLRGKAKGIHAVVTILMGEDKDKSFEVKYGHCIVMGRKINPDLNMDVTVVVKPAQMMYSNLDSHNQQLIEKYLSKGQRKPIAPDQAYSPNNKLLGNFVRNPDFLVGDPSISRAHSVIYQDDDGLNLLDLFSKNGSFVNGYEVESCRLRHNDVISLGVVSMKVSLY